MSKRIILTSFRDAKNHECVKYSIARWQPRGCTYPALGKLAPFFPTGRPITGLDPEPYRYEYEKNVLNSEEAQRQLRGVIDSMNDGDTIALLCWCNLSRQREYPKLMCHRVLVGFWIENNLPGVEVIYLDGADNPVWSNQK